MIFFFFRSPSFWHVRRMHQRCLPSFSHFVRHSSHNPQTHALLCLDIGGRGVVIRKGHRGCVCCVKGREEVSCHTGGERTSHVHKAQATRVFLSFFFAQKATRQVWDTRTKETKKAKNLQCIRRAAAACCARGAARGRSAARAGPLRVKTSTGLRCCSASTGGS